MGRGRHLPKLALGAAVAIFLGSIGISVMRLADQWEKEQRLHRSDTWMASQALVELERFRFSLHRAGGDFSEATVARLQERFEILWSRIPLLLRDEWSEIRPAPEVQDRILLVESILPVIEREMEALQTGDRRAPPRMEALLRELEPALLALNREVYLSRAMDVEAARLGRRRLDWTLLGSVGGLLVSAGVLMVLFALESRHARQARARAEAASARATEAQHTLRVLIDALPTMVLACDRHGRILFANEEVCRFLGLGEVELAGSSSAEFGNLISVEEDIARLAAQPRTLPFTEHTLRDFAGRERILLSTTAPVLDSGGELASVVRIAIDITDRKRAETRMRHMAEHDGLTDLPNRRLLTARLGAVLQELAPKGSPVPGRSVAVHCLDLDRFKEVNDSLGHAAGDKLLLVAAARMLGCLREGDVLARLGGDEFAVIQSQVTQRENAARLAERLVAALSEPFRIDGYDIASGASIGTVVAPEDGRTAEALLQRAEIALYRAKGEGRGRACIFSPELEAELIERRTLEAELREAIERGALFLAYQPKFRIDGGLPAGRPVGHPLGHPLGCEALLRWTHPKRGAISPANFVPIAEETGLVAEMTRQVIEAACRQARSWQEAGHGMPVAVNISASLFGMDRAVELVRRALELTACPPGLLEVEVTESVFLRNAETASRAFAALREMGVRVALDDFGTGYSSLGYLQRLPVDVIKIDRTFIHNLDDGGRSLRIVDAIVRLAHGLGAEAVAEGVETPAQLDALQQLGCDQAQGFLLGRPMPAAELPGFLAGGGAGSSAELRLFGT